VTYQFGFENEVCAGREFSEAAPITYGPRRRGRQRADCGVAAEQVDDFSRCFDVGHDGYDHNTTKLYYSSPKLLWLSNFLYCAMTQ